jgi:hypothetical protein
MVALFFGGAEQDRTVDLLTASQALSQLSYSPTSKRNSFLADQHMCVNHFLHVFPFAAALLLTDLNMLQYSVSVKPEWWNGIHSRLKICRL